MNIIVLEDEPIMIRHIEGLLQQLSFPVHVQAQLSSVQAAIHWLTSHSPPDLILADILLQDGISFEIFDTLQLAVPVIYCTNYQNYVLESFNSHVIDYLLKPITANKLVSSLEKFTKRTHYAGAATPFKKTTEYLSVNDGSSQLRIPILSIRYIVFKEQFARIQTLKNSYVTSLTLEELEQILNPTVFYRANRQYIIHRQSIERIEELPARKIAVWLHPNANAPLVVSKAKASEFLRWSGFK